MSLFVVFLQNICHVALVNVVNTNKRIFLCKSAIPTVQKDVPERP
jgi:hypothetical protein